MNKLTREDAWNLLTEYTETPALQQHALMVEAVMRHFARLAGEDEDVWGVAGLLHDLDYEKYPEEHCKKAVEIMEERGIDPVYIRAMQCHGYGLCCDVEPEHDMEKILFAVDELTGLIGAAVKMRPSGSVMDMEVSSLKKKFKDKRFAAGCSRDVIRSGAERLGWTLDELFAQTLDAMRSCEESVNAQMAAL